MGRYQWCIFLLCGLGYFLDLCWAQALGLVGSAVKQELGVSGQPSLRFLESRGSDVSGFRCEYWTYFGCIQYRSDRRRVYLGSTC